MKICFILPHFNTSGGTRAIFEIASQLSLHDHDITLYCCCTDPAPMQDKRLISLCKRKLYKTASSFYVAINYLEKPVIEWIKIHPRVKVRWLTLNYNLDGLADYDAVIATAWETLAYVRNAPIPLRAKFYFVQHYEIWPLYRDDYFWADVKSCNYVFNVVSHRPKDAYLQWYKSVVDSTYKNDIKKIVTSNWERKIMSAMGVASSVIGSVSYGVSKDFFCSTSTGSEGHQKKGLTVLSLYRGKKEKGDLEVLSAFLQLRSLCPQIELRMFGLTPLPAGYEFIAYSLNPTQEAIVSIYRNSDIFVFPSWVEGYGMPPMEAMACGNAIVATSVGAVPDYANDEGIKFVEPRSSDEIVRAVWDLIQNPSAVQRMKQANLDAINSYTWERSATSFSDILKSSLIV